MRQRSVILWYSNDLLGGSREEEGRGGKRREEEGRGGGKRREEEEGRGGGGKRESKGTNSSTSHQRHLRIARVGHKNWGLSKNA